MGLNDYLFIKLKLDNVNLHNKYNYLLYFSKYKRFIGIIKKFDLR